MFSSAPVSTQLAIAGERIQGKEVRSANITAVSSVANILKSSLGPLGLDKMLVDDIGDVTVTNDGATILKSLEVQHPAAKILTQLSALQDEEVGDGTTSVVLVAAELLKRGNELITRGGAHPTNVMTGYKKALKEAVNFTKTQLSFKTKDLSDDIFKQIAKTSLSSKCIGSEVEKFSTLVYEAIRSVGFISPVDGKVKYPVNQISISKCHGQSSLDTELIRNGYVLNLGRAAQGMPTQITRAKIALLDFDLKKYRMPMGVQINITDPKELEKIRQKEMDITEDRMKKILDAGANVILTSKGIDDMCLKFLAKHKIFAIRRVDKKDLKRIAKITGGRVVLTMNNSSKEFSSFLESDNSDFQISGDEAFDESALGSIDEVYEERVGDYDFSFFKFQKEIVESPCCSILIRGSSDYFVDEVERSVHDALCAVSKAMETATVVSGGGAIETALNVHLSDWAVRSFAGREQLAVLEFAKALLVIPKTLSINSAKTDPFGSVSALRSKYTTVFANEDNWSAIWGLNLTGDASDGEVTNVLSLGVVEPLLSKLKSLKFATEAAITILRIDDLIKLDPDPQPAQ